jgi:hypothetical protein
MGAWHDATDSAEEEEEERKPLAAEIQDNSFFVEEAYNQEPGVVQHIFNALWTVDHVSGGNRQDYNFLFTQEWPVYSQSHQLSYSIPFSLLNAGSDSASGFGDVFLNYRYQALLENGNTPAVAPRLSLIVPTGSEAKGLGQGSFGGQFNLPVSKIVSERWTLHGNAGVTIFPDMHGKSLVNYNLGASAVFAVGRKLNLLLEGVTQWQEQAAFGRIEHSFGALASPGFRYAINAGEAQWVLGLGFPVGLVRQAPDFGVFLYLSFEHPFQHLAGIH